MILRSFLTIWMLTILQKTTLADDDVCDHSATVFTFSQSGANAELADRGSLIYELNPGGTKAINTLDLKVSSFGILTFSNPSSSKKFTFMAKVNIDPANIPVASFDFVTVTSDTNTAKVRIDPQNPARFFLNSVDSATTVPTHLENMFHLAITGDDAGKVSLLLDGTSIAEDNGFSGSSITSISIGSASLASFTVDDIYIAQCALTKEYIGDIIDDVDECSNPATCAEGSNDCINTVNSYICKTCLHLIGGLLAEYNMIADGMLDHSHYSNTATSLHVKDKVIVSAEGIRVVMSSAADAGSIKMPLKLNDAGGVRVISVAFWFKVTTEFSFTVGSGSGSGSKFVIDITSSSITVTVNSEAPLVSDAPYQEGFLAVTVTPSQLKLYNKDASLDKEITFTSEIAIFKMDDLEFNNKGSANEVIDDIRVWPCMLSGAQVLLEKNREYTISNEKDTSTFTIDVSNRVGSATLYETVVAVSTTSDYFTLELTGGGSLQSDCKKSFFEVFDANGYHIDKFCNTDPYPQFPSANRLYVRYVADQSIIDEDLIFTVTKGSFTAYEGTSEARVYVGISTPPVTKGTYVEFDIADKYANEDPPGTIYEDVYALYKETTDLFVEVSIQMTSADGTAPTSLPTHQDCTKSFIEIFTDMGYYHKICPADLASLTEAQKEVKDLVANIYVRHFYTKDDDGHIHLLFFHDENECEMEGRCTDADLGTCKTNEEEFQSDGKVLNTCGCLSITHIEHPNGDLLACQDVDDCVDYSGNSLCLDGAGGTCNNVKADVYTCTCDEHYQASTNGLGAPICEDVDECTDDSSLCANGECKNQDGAAYTCICNNFYEQTQDAGGNNQCTDVDECTDDPSLCANGECKNQDGAAYTCICNNFYEQTQDAGGNNQCTDVDECTDDPSLCANGECKNQDDAPYTCICDNFYEQTQDDGGNNQCTDVDECTDDPSLCANGECKNQDGATYTCICNNFYEQTQDAGGKNQCTDVDECTDDSSLCANGECKNQDGAAYTCICNNFYEQTQDAGGNNQCTDIDECTDTTLCNANLGYGTCQNEDGADHTCSCNTDYIAHVGDGGQNTCEKSPCVDNLECDKESCFVNTFPQFTCKLCQSNIARKAYFTFDNFENDKPFFDTFKQITMTGTIEPVSRSHGQSPSLKLEGTEISFAFPQKEVAAASADSPITPTITPLFTVMAWFYIPIMFPADFDFLILTASPQDINLSLTAPYLTGIVLPEAQWFHLAITRDGDAGKEFMYLNGVVFSSMSMEYVVPLDTLTIDATGTKFYLDDLYVGECVMDAQTIRDHAFDINECLAANDCEVGEECVNTPGSYYCKRTNSTISTTMLEYIFEKEKSIDHSFHLDQVNSVDVPTTSFSPSLDTYHLRFEGAGRQYAVTLPMEARKDMYAMTVSCFFKVTTSIKMVVGTPGSVGSFLAIEIDGEGLSIDVTLNDETNFNFVADFEGFFAVSIAPGELRAYGLDGTLPKDGKKVLTTNYEPFAKQDVYLEQVLNIELPDEYPARNITSVQDTVGPTENGFDNIRIWPFQLTDHQVLIERFRQYNTRVDLVDSISGNIIIDTATSTLDRIYEFVQGIRHAEDYLVLQIVSKTMQTDCSKSFFEIYDIADEGYDGATFRHKYCGGDHFDKFVSEVPFAIRYVADETITDDYLEFKIVQGEFECDDPIVCTELYPGCKCAACSSGESGKIVHLDFNLRDEQNIDDRITLRTFTDQTGNGYHGYANRLQDVLLVPYFGDTSFQVVNQRYAQVSCHGEGIFVDVSRFDDLDRKDFSVTFRFKIADASLTGDLVAFNAPDGSQRLAIRYTQGTLVLYTSDKQTPIINLANDALTLNVVNVWYEVYLSANYRANELIFGFNSNTGTHTPITAPEAPSAPLYQEPVPFFTSDWTEVVIGKRACVTDTLDSFDIDEFVISNCAYTADQFAGRTDGPTKINTIEGVMELTDGVLKLSGAISQYMSFAETTVFLKVWLTLPQLEAGLVYLIKQAPHPPSPNFKLYVKDGADFTQLTSPFPVDGFKTKTGKVTVTLELLTGAPSPVFLVTQVVADCVGDGCQNKQCKSEFDSIELWVDMTKENSESFFKDISSQILHQVPGTAQSISGVYQDIPGSKPGAHRITGVRGFSNPPGIVFNHDSVISVSFWHNPLGNSEATILTFKQNNAEIIRITANIPDQKYSVKFFGAKVLDFPVTISAYTNYVLLVEGSGHVKFYQSGVLVSSLFFEEASLFTSNPATLDVMIGDANTMNFGQLRIYSCVLSDKTIRNIAERLYVETTTTLALNEQSTQEITADTNMQFEWKFDTDDSKKLKVEVRGNEIACLVTGMAFIEDTGGVWIDICNTPAPFEYYSKGSQVYIHYIATEGDLLTVHVTRVEDQCENAACPFCMNLEKHNFFCMGCTFDDLYTKTFINFDVSNRDTYGINAEDTIFANKGHLAPDVQYFFFEDVNGVPEFAFTITAQLLLKSSEGSGSILAVYDKQNKLHLWVYMYNFKLMFWMQNEHGEESEFETASNAVTSDSYVGVPFTIVVMHNGLFSYEYPVEFLRQTPAEQTNFRSFNRDWSRVEIGRDPNGETSLFPIGYLTVTGCVMDATLLNHFKYRLPEPLPPVTETVSHSITDTTKRYSVHVDLPQCHVGYISFSRDLDPSIERFVERVGSKLINNCDGGCVTQSNSAVYIYSGHQQQAAMPNNFDAPPIPAVTVTVTDDVNECACGLHDCISDQQCKNKLASYSCEYCKTGDRKSLLVSTDYEHSNEPFYRDATNNLVWMYRYDKDGLNALHEESATPPFISSSMQPLNTTTRPEAQVIPTATLTVSKTLHSMTVHFWFLVKYAQRTPVINGDGDQLRFWIDDDRLSTIYDLHFELKGMTGSIQDIQANQRYEVALLVSFTSVQFYVDGRLISETPLDEPMDIVPMDLVIVDNSPNGYIKDLEVWKCVRPEYRKPTEIKNEELSEFSGVITAEDFTDTSKSSYLHTYLIQITGPAELHYELTMTDMDCSYAHFCVLEQDGVNTRWKDYCDPQATIYGWIGEGKLYVKYINTDPTKRKPDFLFKYQGDVNECAQADRCNTDGGEGCHNNIQSFYCAKCGIDIQDDRAFLALHSVFFDFEETENEGSTVVNKQNSAANGELIGGSAYVEDREVTNNYMVTFDSGLKVDGLALYNLPVDEFSVIIFINLLEADVKGARPLFYSYNKHGQANIVFELHDGRPYVEVRDTRNNIIVKHWAKESTPVEPSTWTLVAFTFDGTSLMLYINDNPPSSKEIINTRPVSQDWSGGIKIAYQDEESYYNGFFQQANIDDFRIVNCALTSSQINYLVGSFNPGCILDVGEDNQVSVPVGKDPVNCGRRLSLPPGSVFTFTKLATCADAGETITIVDGDVEYEMCAHADRNKYTTKNAAVTILYKNTQLPPGSIVSFAIDEDECWSGADVVHTCGEGKNCYNGDGFYTCKRCSQEFGSTLMIHYDFEDNGQILNKALSRTHDISSVATFADSVFNKGLNSLVSTAINLEEVMTSRYMTISFWISGDSDSLSEQSVFNFNNIFTVTISGTHVKVLLYIGNTAFNIEAVKPTTSGRLYCAVTFYERQVTLHLNNDNGNTMQQVQIHEDFSMTGRLDIGSSQGEDVRMDELKIYDCVLPDEIIAIQKTRSYTSQLLDSYAEKVVTAQADGLKGESFEGRWYIVPADNTEQIFVHVLAVKTGGFLKVRDETDPSDGRDDWVTVTEPKTFTFTSSVTIWYFSDAAENDDVVFEFVRDLNECNTDSNDCENPDNCVNILGTYFCENDCNLDETMVLHFDFSKIHENTVLDVSGQENHGTLVNHVKFINTASPLGPYAVIGASQGINIDNFHGVPRHAITIAVWIRLAINDDKGVRPVFNVFDSSKKSLLSLDIVDKKPILTHENGFAHVISNEHALTEDHMNFVVWTFSNSRAKLYLNGAKVYDVAGQDFPWSFDWDKVQIGRKDGFLLEWLHADIDELKMFNCELSAEKIQTLFEAFDPFTYYCRVEQTTSDSPGSVASPTADEIGEYVKTSCRYVVDVGTGNVVRYYFTGADAGDTFSLTDPAETKQFMPERLELLFEKNSGVVDFTIKWELDVDECLGEENECGDEMGCVNRFHDTHLCKYCTGVDEQRLVLFYNFNRVYNGMVKNRAPVNPDLIIPPITGVTDITDTINPINQHYLQLSTNELSIDMPGGPSDQMTIFVLVRPNSPNDMGPIFMSNDPDTVSVIRVYIESNKVFLLIHREGSDSVVTSVDVIDYQPGSWLSIAAIYNGVEAYVKVAKVTDAEFTSSPRVSFTGKLPATWQLTNVLGKNDLGHRFDGDLDEFYVFSCAIHDDYLINFHSKHYEQTVLKEAAGKVHASEHSVSKKAIEYQWTIERQDEATTVSFDIVDFNVDCKWGFLEVLQEPQGDWKRLCGEEDTPKFRLIQNDIVIRYVRSNAHESEDTFNILYTTETDECFTDEHKCRRSDHCLNTFGSYHCIVCPDGEQDSVFYLNFDDTKGIEVRDRTDKQIVALSSTDDLLVKKAGINNFLSLPAGRYLTLKTQRLRSIPRYSMTVDALVFLPDTDGCHPLFHVIGKEEHPMLKVDIVSGNVKVDCRDSDNNLVELVTSASLTKNVWTFITVTVDIDKKLKILLDLQEVASVDFVGEIHQDWETIFVGINPALPHQSLNGDVADIALYACQVEDRISPTVTIYSCDEKYTDEGTWSLPEASLMTAFQSVDCRYTLEANEELVYFVRLIRNTVDCSLSTLSVQFDDQPMVDVCADGWPSSGVIKVRKMTILYTSQDVTDTQKFIIAIDKTSICGENSHYYPASELCTCKNGFIKVDQQCIDLDECALNLAQCNENAKCENLIGSYQCHCLPGYSGDGTTCKAKNPCMMKMCGVNENCVWEDASIVEHKCICKDGYQLQDQQCLPVDMCALNGEICPMHAQCNEEGSCECKPGFVDEHQQCIDENECLRNASPCDKDNEECVNNFGSYKCLCKQGYRFDLFSQQCQDLNECLGLNSCSVESICKNTEGAYDCVCKQGYNMVAGQCCDVNECGNDDLNDCSPHAKCINTEASFTCHCNTGFTGDGKICQDKRECDGDDPCTSDERCVEEDGTFHCVCKQGYYRQADLCLEVKETDNDNGNNGNDVSNEEEVWKNTDICDKPCGKEGRRNTEKQCKEENCESETLPCNRFSCFHFRNAVKSKDTCTELPSMNGDSTTENDVLEHVGWSQQNTQQINEAMLFTANWLPKVQFNAFWNDQTCLELAKIREEYELDLSAVNALVGHLDARKNKLRMMYHCNANAHIRPQLERAYTTLTLRKKFALLDSDRIEKRIHDAEQTCSGQQWFLLAHNILQN